MSYFRNDNINKKMSIKMWPSKLAFRYDTYDENQQSCELGGVSKWEI